MKLEKYTITLLITLLLGTLTTTAQEEDMRLRGCRRSMRPTSAPLRRTSGTPRQAGGDFYTGDRKQLVVMASFQDQAFADDSVAATLAKWDKIFNTENYHEAPFTGSIHDYFRDQSQGKFNLQFDLIYVQLPDSLQKYHSTRDHDENSQYMVDDIVDILQTQDINWSQYDWNKDGYINQLLIIYAGLGQNAGGGSNTIWPHQWWLSEHFDQSDPSYSKRSYRTVQQGQQEYRIDTYCCLQEIASRTNSHPPFGTICHEYSHCFGFPDFYNNSKNFIGAWDLMDSGNYNNDNHTPPNYSAHERWLMGWIQPTELTTDTLVSDMPSLCDTPTAYLIRNDGYENEYYIIENRQQTGWDSYLPGSGLLIFHIDFDESIWTSITTYANNSTKQRYHIIPANNKTSYSQNTATNWAYPYATNDSLTNHSTPAATLNNPNTDGTLFMNKSLHDIRIENGLATFRFAAATSPATSISALPATTTSQPQELYRIGPIRILRYPDGHIKKVIIP